MLEEAAEEATMEVSLLIREVAGARQEVIKEVVLMVVEEAALARHLVEVLVSFLRIED